MNQRDRHKELFDELKRNENLVLELGSGDTKRERGWITVDFHEDCDIIHDLREDLPFPDNTFLNIYSSHVLEHFEHDDLIRLIKEIYRILKFKGIFRVCVPDASIYLDAYFNPEQFDAEFFCHYRPAYHVYSKIDYVNYIAYMAGHHKIMFDRENLPRILRSVGFRTVEERAFDPRFDLAKRDYESIYFSAVK